MVKSWPVTSQYLSHYWLYVDLLTVTPNRAANLRMFQTGEKISAHPCKACEYMIKCYRFPQIIPNCGPIGWGQWWPWTLSRYFSGTRHYFLSSVILSIRSLIQVTFCHQFIYFFKKIRAMEACDKRCLQNNFW